MSRNLEDMVRQLAQSSRVYSDAFSDLARQAKTLDSVKRLFAHQLAVDRRIFSHTDSVLRYLSTQQFAVPSVRTLSLANESLARAIGSLTFEDSAVAKAVAEQNRFQSVLTQFPVSQSVTNAIARMDTTRVLSASLLAQEKLAALGTMSLGRLLGFDDVLQRTTATRLEKLTASYRILMDASTSGSFVGQFSVIARYPPIECFREVRVIESVTSEETEDSEVSSVVETEIREVVPPLDNLLGNLDPSLLPMLVGARESLRSENPDRVRHVTTSLRELFAQVLHALAPNEQVRAWTSRKDLFHEDRPTRRARLLYVCRSIGVDSLSQFVEDDVRAAVSLLDALNAGTHVVESQLTPLQLQSLASRMESLLVFLLQLGLQ